MKKILKMTDISLSEAKSELSFVRYASLATPHLEETKEGVVLSCEVNEQNRLVFAEIFRTFSQFVYSDSEETALERFCSIVDVRNLKVGLFEQGTRGKIARAMLSSGLPVEDNVVAGLVVTNTSALEQTNKIVLEQMKEKCDVVIETEADFEENPLVPTRSRVRIWNGEDCAQKQYDFLGTKEDVADRLAFFALALAIKKIF